MTIAELLSYRSFNKFMALEYGYEPNELIDLSASDLYAYMSEWFYSPFAPSGTAYERIRVAVEEEKQVKEGRKRSRN